MDPTRSNQHDKSGAAPRRDTHERAAEAERAQPHPLMRLQQQIGNQQVQRMLAQRQGAEEEEIQALHDPALQRQGAEEEEIQALHDPALQRQADAPEVGMEGGPVSSALAQRIESQRGSGSPLAEPMRERMEQSLNAPLDDVRVHSDSASATLNRAVSAKAFTTGSDIFLGANASASDTGLMAHELTHVVQQRSMSSSGPMSVSPAGDQHEQEADRVSAAVTSAPAPAQRMPDEQESA